MPTPVIGGAPTLFRHIYSSLRYPNPRLPNNGRAQNPYGRCLGRFGAKCEYAARRLPKCSWHVPARSYLLAFSGYDLGSVSEPVVSYRNAQRAKLQIDPRADSSE